MVIHALSGSHRVPVRVRSLPGGRSKVDLLAEIDAHALPGLLPSWGEYPVYDDLTYEIMSRDEARNRAYRAAIASAVAGKVVVDIGAGRDLNWARESVAAGAARVYALEASESAHGQAVELARREGIDDRVHVLHGFSREISLPERADVCVSEIVGCLAGSEGLAAILSDARVRFLKPGGLMIPSRCETHIVACTLPAGIVENPCFETLSIPYIEAIFEVVGHPMDVRLTLTRAGRELGISDSKPVETFDLANDLRPDGISREVLTVERDAPLHGFACWIKIWPSSNLESPSIDARRRDTHWLPIFLPVFFPGIPVRGGERIEIEFERRSSVEGTKPDYFLRGRLATRKPAVEFRVDLEYAGAAFRAVPLYQALFPISL